MWTLSQSHIHYDVGDGVRKSMPMRWAYTRWYGVTWAALQRYVMPWAMAYVRSAMCTCDLADADGRGWHLRVRRSNFEFHVPRR